MKKLGCRSGFHLCVCSHSLAWSMHRAHVRKYVCVCVYKYIYIYTHIIYIYVHETFLSVTGNLLTAVTFDEHSWEYMEPWAFSLNLSVLF